MCVGSLRKALDVVRERIDGEAFVVPWSSIDTTMGMLNVHLDKHAFDAELYAYEPLRPPTIDASARCSPPLSSCGPSTSLSDVNAAR